jgi:integrase
MRLWPVAEPKPLRFHDLRHSTATLLLKAKVPLATVQRILRHTDPKITRRSTATSTWRTCAKG